MRNSFVLGNCSLHAQRANFTAFSYRKREMMLCGKQFSFLLMVEGFVQMHKVSSDDVRQSNYNRCKKNTLEIPWTLVDEN